MALIPLPRTGLACLAAACLTLAACGTAEETPLRAIVGSATGQLGADTAEEPAADPWQTLTRQTIEQVGRALMLLEVSGPVGDGASVMVRVGSNRGVESWRDSGGIGVALTETGLLRSTRGLGFDLMASDPSGTARALTARHPAEVNRVMVHLNGELQEDRVLHRCRITVGERMRVDSFGRSYDTTAMRETCTRPDGADYTNRYWVEASGRIRRSEQWVSDEIGLLRLERLSD